MRSKAEAASSDLVEAGQVLARSEGQILPCIGVKAFLMVKPHNCVSSLIQLVSLLWLVIIRVWILVDSVPSYPHSTPLIYPSCCAVVTQFPRFALHPLIPSFMQSLSYTVICYHPLINSLGWLSIYYHILYYLIP